MVKKISNNVKNIKNIDPIKKKTDESILYTSDDDLDELDNDIHNSVGDPFDDTIDKANLDHPPVIEELIDSETEVVVDDDDDHEDNNEDKEKDIIEEPVEIEGVDADDNNEKEYGIPEAEDNDDGCMYKFALKKQKLDGDDEDEEDEYFDDDGEIYEDDNKLAGYTVVNPEDRITHPILFKYERVRILGVRTKQLSLGAKSMMKNTEDFTPKEIAQLELKNKIVPYIIERLLPNNKCEEWRLSELEIIN